jgi:curved DNA-binding protein CbpA
MSAADPYVLLGVPRDATTPQIKRAFRAAAKRHHPDRGGDAEEMGRIMEAYRLLSSPERRQEWDEGHPAGMRLGLPEFEKEAFRSVGPA